MRSSAQLLANPRHLAADLLAGFQGAVSSLPGGMAAAVLVGVHPIQGLYACVAGPIAGGVTARTRLMIITTTGAAAFAAGSALHKGAARSGPAAVALLTPGDVAHDEQQHRVTGRRSG